MYLGDTVMSGAPLSQWCGTSGDPSPAGWIILGLTVASALGDRIRDTDNILHRTAVLTSDPSTDFCVEMAPVCVGQCLALGRPPGVTVSCLPPT